MTPNSVIVTDYDPQWPRIFEALRDRVLAALGELAVQIEHVGSTSVPGLAAKPIVDMDVVIASESNLSETISRLDAIGYKHQGDLGIAGREAFTQPSGLPEHHLYVCVNGADELRRHIAFRDYLRSHPDDARQYSEVKRAAAQQFGNDRLAYMEAKRQVVEAILSRALEA